MNRHYRAQDAAALIEGIHAKIPLAAIGVVLMSGFPGEDAASHAGTLKLMEALPVSYFHVFPFSPRPGTKAWAFQGRLEPALIKERAAELRALGRHKRAAFYRRCTNREFAVLGEGWHSEKKGLMKGTSDNYLPVIFPCPGDATGRLIPVRTEKVAPRGLFGSATLSSPAPRGS